MDRFLLIKSAKQSLKSEWATKQMDQHNQVREMAEEKNGNKMKHLHLKM